MWSPHGAAIVRTFYPLHLRLWFAKLMRISFQRVSVRLIRRPTLQSVCCLFTAPCELFPSFQEISAGTSTQSAVPLRTAHHHGAHADYLIWANYSSINVRIKNVKLAQLYIFGIRQVQLAKLFRLKRNTDVTRRAHTSYQPHPQFFHQPCPLFIITGDLASWNSAIT